MECWFQITQSLLPGHCPISLLLCALDLLPQKYKQGWGGEHVLTVDDLLPVNLSLVQPGHHVLAHGVLPVLSIWLWFQVRELAQIIF